MEMINVEYYFPLTKNSSFWRFSNNLPLLAGSRIVRAMLIMLFIFWLLYVLKDVKNTDISTCITFIIFISRPAYHPSWQKHVRMHSGLLGSFCLALPRGCFWPQICVQDLLRQYWITGGRLRHKMITRIDAKLRFTVNDMSVR